MSSTASAVTLAALLLILASLVVGLVAYILRCRYRNVQDFIAHRRGRSLMRYVGRKKGRVRICSCCGGDVKTAASRPNCIRNPANRKKK